MVDREEDFDVQTFVSEPPVEALDVRSSSQLPRVAMVQPTDTGNRDDLPHFPRLDRPLLGSVLIEPQLRSVLVVVVNRGPDPAPKLPLLARDHMVQAVAS